MATTSYTQNLQNITTKVLYALKQKGEKIAMLTAYDYITAKFCDEAGIEVILVGDSLSNVIQGNETTLPVTLEEMIYHTKIVRRGVKKAMVVADMTFMSYQVGLNEAIQNCGRVMKETGCDGIKMEGGKYICEIVSKLVEIGIPVLGHLGLTPQSINKFGSYKTRGIDKEEAEQIFGDSIVLEQAGCVKLYRNLLKLEFPYWDISDLLHNQLINSEAIKPVELIRKKLNKYSEIQLFSNRQDVFRLYLKKFLRLWEQRFQKL